MEIKLDSEWSIVEAGYTYELRKWTGKITVDKNGEESKNFDFQSYPPTLESAVKQYIKRKMSEDKSVVTLNQYVTEFKELYLKIKNDLNL